MFPSIDSSSFIYHPPSRYIFYGAEITNSPVHSPFGSPIPSDANNSDDSSDNGSLLQDDFECSNVEGNGYNSSGDGSEGYGSGVMSNTDTTSYDLKLITGALGSYHCVSEDNSVMSGLDLLTESTSTKENLLSVSSMLDNDCIDNYKKIDNTNDRTDNLDIIRNARHSEEPFHSDLESIKPGWMT